MLYDYSFIMAFIPGTIKQKISSMSNPVKMKDNNSRTAKNTNQRAII